MHDFDLFDFYRFMLTVLVGTYSAVRLAAFIWRWQSGGVRSAVGSTLGYRYLVVLLLRLRFRGFIYEFSVIGGLFVLLVLLIRLHWS